MIDLEAMSALSAYVNSRLEMTLGKDAYCEAIDRMVGDVMDEFDIEDEDDAIALIWKVAK